MNEKYLTTLTNYKLIDGLTSDIIKRKYIWLLNAIVNDAIIGQDDYGLVWYSGDWIAGEWEDGTWYSGTWHDGEWKNGNFYSYRFDTKQLLQRNKRILETTNPIFSQFKHGIWRRGSFYNGIFGEEKFNEVWDYYSLPEIVYYGTRWESGTFFDGIFRNSVWYDGNFHNGIFYNSQWLKGTFINGTFQGNKWWNGKFTGGDFILGVWSNGIFNQGNPNIRSRFGSMPLTGNTNMAGTSVIWTDGQFINGEFHSGLNLISGITATSDNHNRTVWINGIWYNGAWYGGTHISGEFNNGYWFEGLWSGGTFNNGYWFNGFWLDGIINDGFFVQGIFKNVTFNGGKLGFQPPTYLTYSQIASLSGFTVPPKYLGFLPTVTTVIPTGITTTTCICGGIVKSDGGEDVLLRGVCWSSKTNYPSINDDITQDGYGLGGFSSQLFALERGTKYWVRAYAINLVGTSYGNIIPFTTSAYD